MPGSSQFGKVYTALVLGKLFESGLIRRVVDVGAGSGTYRKLVGIVDGATEAVHWTAVEAWTPYIAEFDLTALYDTVVNVNVRDFVFAEAKPDLVIFGDVIEHMTKEEAVEVVARAVAAASYVLISLPIVHYPQGEINGNPFERHVKDDWSNGEVMASFDNIATIFIHDHIGVYVLSDAVDAVRNVRTVHDVVAQLMTERFPDDFIRANRVA